MKEFVTAFDEAAKESEGIPVEDQYVEFKVDDRVLRAYVPTDGQLTFMMAAMGRGQTNNDRFAAILNILMESLRGDDQDYLESRLLTRDPKRRLGVKTIEQIFEYVSSEWFARPTQSQSDSVSTEPSTGTSSTPTTGESTSSD